MTTTMTTSATRSPAQKAWDTRRAQGWQPPSLTGPAPSQAARTLARRLSRTRLRAAKSGLECTITLDELKAVHEHQGERCKVSGRAFNDNPCEAFVRYSNGMSLDRIDNTRGYVPGDVQIVTAQANLAMNEFGTAAFIALCQDVVQHQRKRLRRS